MLARVRTRLRRSLLAGLCRSACVVIWLVAAPAVAREPVVPPGVEAFQPLRQPLGAEEILARVAQILPGRFDNMAQLALAGSESATAYRLTTIITPVDIPALGGRLYHVEEFRDGDPSALTRIRLYQFSNDAGAVMMHVLNPTDMEALRGVHNDPRPVVGLTWADIKPDRAVCALVVHAFGEGLVARMRTGACRVDALWVDYELLIGTDVQLTCHARRARDDDRLEWLQMPAFPCIRQVRVRDNTE
jgi:hypothetical protein